MSRRGSRRGGLALALICMLLILPGVPAQATGYGSSSGSAQSGPLPDLRIEVDGPQVVEAGQEIGHLVTLWAINKSSGSAPGYLAGGPSYYKIDLVLSRDEQVPMRYADGGKYFQEDMLLGRVYETHTLAPGEVKSYSVGARIPADTPSGMYCLMGVIDPGGMLAETNESNNVSCLKIEVRGTASGPGTQPPQQGTVCLDFSSQPAGDRPREFQIGAVKFHSDQGTSVMDLTGDGALDLYFTNTMYIYIPASSFVQVQVVHYGQPVKLEARNSSYHPVADTRTTGADGTVETLTVTADQIAKLVLYVGEGQAAVVSLCYGHPGQTGALKCSAPAFKDVPADHPACAAIQMLVGHQVISGYGDKTFRPAQPVTRAEFAKLLVLAMGKQPDTGGNLPFTDVSGHWAATQGFLQAAVQLGAIGGFPDSTFKPNTFISRAEGVKVAAAAFNSTGAVLLQVEPALPADVPADAWYRPHLSVAVRAGLMGEGATFPVYAGDRFDGARPMTRGEAAMLLANLMLQVKA